MAKFLSPVLLHQSQQKFQPSFTRTAVVIRIADIREMDMEIHIESVEILSSNQFRLLHKKKTCWMHISNPLNHGYKMIQAVL